MNVLERLLFYQSCHPEDKSGQQMIQTILDNFFMIKNFTINELADLCYTSTTSIIRLCAKLGYKNFSAFRTAVQETINTYDFINHPLPVESAQSSGQIRHALIDRIAQHMRIFEQMDDQLVESASELIHAHKECHIFSHYLNPIAVLGLQQNLIMDGKKTGYYANEQIADGIKHLTADCVALIDAPYLPREIPMLKEFEEIKKTGAATILFIYKDLGCWKNADIKICANGLGCRLDAHISDYFYHLLSSLYRNKFIF